MTQLDTELEEYGTSRADFRQLSADERENLTTALRAARSQVEVLDLSDIQHIRELAEKRSLYFYKCAEYGVDVKEARAMWWNFVYDEPSPQERRECI